MHRFRFLLPLAPAVVAVAAFVSCDRTPSASVAVPVPTEEVIAVPEAPPAERPPAPPLPEMPAAPVKPVAMQFRLPTENDALFFDDGPAFFMFVDRYDAKGNTTPWQAGSYGFVRNRRETAEGIVFTRFHEGMDIVPMHRDAKGEPLDIVTAVADGTVVYCTANSRMSNYGNYVVIAHPIKDRGTYYSLSAHLREIDTAAGTVVKMGDAIGRLGYTGAGIDRRRAHVHFELCLLLSERFDSWYGIYNKLGNPHGNYHGSNLLGLDVPAFFKANHEDPSLMPDDFLRQGEPYFRVRIANTGRELEIAARYPALRLPGAPSASWEITCCGTGIPVSIAPSPVQTGDPVVSWVKPFSGSHSWNTRSLLTGTGNTAGLSSSGRQFISLLTGDFDDPAPK